MQTTQAQRAQSDVSILGLGMMGQRLVELYQQHGLRVTVWNRTAEKATALAARGAQVAASAPRGAGGEPDQLDDRGQ